MPCRAYSADGKAAVPLTSAESVRYYNSVCWDDKPSSVSGFCVIVADGSKPSECSWRGGAVSETGKRDVVRRRNVLCCTCRGRAVTYCVHSCKVSTPVATHTRSLEASNKASAHRGIRRAVIKPGSAGTAGRYKAAHLQ